MPAKEMKVLRYRPNSTAVEAEYRLNIHERDLKISNVSSVHLPIYITVLEAGLPEGVMLDIEEYDSEKEKFRYVPDKTLLDLKGELEELNAPRK